MMFTTKTNNDMFTSSLQMIQSLKDNHSKRSIPDYYTYDNITNLNIWLQFMTTITAILIPVSFMFYISTINISQQVNSIICALFIINTILFNVSLFRRIIITKIMMKFLGVKKHYNIMQCNEIGRKPLDSFNNGNSLGTLHVCDNIYAYSRKAQMLISYAVELEALDITQDELNDIMKIINDMYDGNIFSFNMKMIYYDVIIIILEMKANNVKNKDTYEYIDFLKKDINTWHAL